MSNHRNRPVVAYLRTSSATNVGDGKDSHVRQGEAVRRYAKSAGLTIEATFYDAAVSGADPIDQRPDFARLLDYLGQRGGGIVLDHMSA